MASDRFITDDPFAASPRRRLPASLFPSLRSLASRVSVEGLLLFWFVASPLASFYVRFPLDKSLVTFNRGVIALAVGLLLMKAWADALQPAGPGWRRAFTATKFELSWALVATIALVNAMWLADDFTYALKLAVDTFWLPLVAFHLARYHFDGRGRAATIWLAAAALGWFLLATGAYEFLTGANLFQYKGSELVREGERRVNGPFAADSSYAIICLLIFVLLLSAPKLFALQRDKAARLFTAGALVAATVAVLLPMFRSAAFALIACWLIVRFATRQRDASLRLRVSASRFRLAAVAVLLLIAVIGGAALVGLAPGGRLTNPRNVIGRLATWESAAAITMDNPLVGVGLANYAWAFDQRYFYSDQETNELLETPAANSPHSNLLWVASEMGVIAFLLYVVANAYLFLLGWRALRRARSAGRRAAAAGFLAIFVAYWLPGLTLASGYYSDANLYFFFLLGLLSNESLVSGA